MRPNYVHFTLLVTEYDLAIEFYCKQLGMFTVAVDSPMGKSSRYVILDFLNSNHPFALTLDRVKPSFNREGALPVGRQAGNAVLFCVSHHSPKRVFETLSKHNIPACFEEIPTGEQVIVSDPFGNKICIQSEDV